MLTPFVLGLVRHILTTAGGALVAAGYLEAEAASQIAGALMSIAGVAWSIIDKQLRA